MKLKNKKTGQTGYYLHTHRDHKDGHIKVAVLKDGVPFSEFKPYEPIYDYDSLAELNTEWEDYEEDELLYVISAEHKSGYQCVLKEEYPEICEVAKELGIGFETEKECQEFCNKLLAWKRLKDKGFRFNNCKIEMSEIVVPEVTITAFIDTEEPETLNLVNLLFGGEE